MQKTEEVLPDGRCASRIDLRSAAGVSVALTNLGATILGIDAPDLNGQAGPVLLGYGSIAAYPSAGGAGADAYLGATCGRYGNRIAGAAFQIDSRRHTLAANEGRNQLHGGPAGFHRQIWTIAEAGAQHAVFRHTSPHGDQGFPGTLEAEAHYTLSDDGELSILYEARSSRPTHVNLVSHGYFDLSAGADATILDHDLQIAADHFLEVDGEAIPTGRQLKVAGTAFDFRRSRRIGDAIEQADPQLSIGRGYNHNYILPGDGMRQVAELRHGPSGRMLTVATDRPGLQFYTGDWLGAPFHPRAGLCLETQAWPDSPNRPEFPSTRLDPGQVYRSETRLRFGIAPAG